MKHVVVTVSSLAEGHALAPERYMVREGEGVPLGELLGERRERFDLSAAEHAVVLDTTHARDGLLDLAAARRADAPRRSPKKRARGGDLLVSRLRPYLRQIAWVPPSADEGPAIACSTEFYVLAPRGGSLAYLVPWLLSSPAQRQLAEAQEGGHHPRVPRDALFALRVPHALVRRRAAASREAEAVFEAAYGALGRVARLIG